MTPKEDAIQSRSTGETVSSIATRLGVHRNTIRNWTDPVAYKRNMQQSLEWQKSNPKHLRQTDAQRLHHNAYQRHRYATNESVRERFRRLASKYRSTEQGRMATVLRWAALGHSDKFSRVHEAFMVAVTGMSRDKFSVVYGDEGQLDHIVPLIAFDLTNPEHVVRAQHPSNIRVISREENQRKGDAGRDTDVMTLPWIETTEALDQARSLISRVLSRIDKLENSLQSGYTFPNAS